jgi:PAS domain S-box-containing protein
MSRARPPTAPAKPRRIRARDAPRKTVDPSASPTIRLAASELRYRRLFEAAQDGILILDARTAEVVEVNPFLADLLGYSREEFIGKKLWEIGPFRNTDAAKTAFIHLQTTRYIRYEDMPLETKTGQLINVEFVSNVYPVDGTVVIQCNIRDITARKRADEAFRHSQQQQLQIRDQFLSRMSHELRSPLTPIHQFVTILLDGLAGDLKDQQREYLQIVLRRVNGLRTMINDLLEVTRAEAGKLHVDLRCVYLTELIPEVLESFQAAGTKNIRPSGDVPADLPPVCADPDRVRQILDNLLDNAIKFTPDRGGVTVRARATGRDREFVRIEVADTGCGIPRKERERIFEYLHQVPCAAAPSPSGLGIGLYICKELVSRQGGRISVRSRPGRGSTFTFTLPVFSLEGQVASLVKAADMITHSIALVTVEISGVGARRLKGTVEKIGLHEAWRRLQSCTVPNLVTLLPRVPQGVSKETFFIVACVNRSGAKVLVEQLRSQLELGQTLRDAGLAARLSFILLRTRATRGGAPANGHVDRKVVEHIEDVMRKAVHSEGGGI